MPSNADMQQFVNDTVLLEPVVPAVEDTRRAVVPGLLGRREHGPLGWTSQALPRHPVQLYEAAGILAVLVVLLLIVAVITQFSLGSLLLFVLFVKHMPSVSMTEMKETVLPGGHHGG